MRIAIGGFTHETNTFHPQPTTLAGFQGPEGTWLHGEAIVDHYAHTRSVLAGMLDAGREQGWTIVPTFFANFPPITGLIEAQAFDAIRDNLVTTMADAKADGLLLHLHGAGAAANAPDPEAVVLRDLRAKLGRQVPLVVVYDLHANIGAEWWEHADAIIGYKTAPHTDFYERGVEGARVLERMLRHEITPVVVGAKPPVMIKAGLMSMTSGPLALIKPPMYWLMQRAAEMERHPAIVNVSVAAGFGDADTPVTGMTMLVTADRDRALAEAYAAELAALAWRVRRGLDTDLVMTPVYTAIERALHAPAGPVILADQGNNTAGGSPGDGTAILAGLQAADWPDAALFLRDEAAVGACWSAGVGREVEVSIGGKHEPLNGDPVTVRGVVHLLTLGETRHVTDGPLARMGQVAVLRAGATDIVLTQYATSQTHPGYFRVAGIEPRDRRIIVVQSAHLFREAFEVQERIPRMILEVDTPGITSPNARRFTYHQVSRPIYPLDDMDWTP